MGVGQQWGREAAERGSDPRTFDGRILAGW